MIKNIAIIGVGGVGGYFGGKLCAANKENSGQNISFIARGTHLDEIRNKGLTLNTSDEGKFICRPSIASNDLNELPDPDLCVICVKGFDLEAALIKLKSKIKPHTIVLPLLNGVDIYSRIREILTDGIVLPACVYVGTHIEKPGVVTQKGGACKILMGKDPAHAQFRPEELFSIFNEANIKYEWFDDVYPQIWQKYIFIASFGLVTACFDKTIGEVMESRELSSYAKSVISETVSLAKQQNIVLPSGIEESSFNKAKNFPHETKTSFQRDFERLNKKDERELFGGTVIRLCKDEKIDCPVTEKLYEMLEEKKKLPPQRN